MNIIEAPERPVLQIDPEFKWCSDECRRDTNLWLLKMFGTRSIVPRGTAYIVKGLGLVVRPEDAVMIRNIAI